MTKEDFDFDSAEEVKTKPKTKEELEKENADLKHKIATSGSPTAAVIKEARKLAASKTGLDIEAFFIKHRLVGVDLEQLLHAPLNEDGTYA